MVKKKTSLYTSATLNGGWLLYTIDIALWLHKSDGYEEVTVNCVSNNNHLNFFRLFLQLKNFSNYLNVKKFKNFFTFSSAKKVKASELSNFALGRLDYANLVIGDLRIKFIRIKISKKKLDFDFISIIHKVIADYFKYFKKSALKQKLYLKYQVSNIYAGLHILSEALRSDYRSYGSILHCRLGILAALYKLHSSLNSYKKIVLPRETNTFVCGPAQEYIYGFFSRFLSDQGACFIDTSCMQAPFIKQNLKDKYYSRLKIYRPKNDDTIPDKQKIFDHYKTRIEFPWLSLDYMHFLKNKKVTDKKIINIKGLTVILYLHSFTDAQYYYGYDGYNDLMHWALRTVHILNSNKHVSRIIIKPHPGINPIHHPGDAIANKYLKSKSLQLEKVQWADFHFDVNHFKSSELLVGVTHHGSVAEELVFSKIPVIASTNAPWGKEYKFGYWWNNQKEYEDLISSKSITNLVVTNAQIDELCRYAKDQYFNINSDVNFQIDSSWQDMLKIYDKEDCHEHSQNMEQINYLISELEPEEKKFKEYIAKRIHRINLLSSKR